MVFENSNGLKTASALGVTSPMNWVAIASGIIGVGVMEGVFVMVGVNVIVGVNVMVGVSVMVDVCVTVGEGGKTL
jgi:hypothetical protein